jgi:hypothetical protein
MRFTWLRPLRQRLGRPALRKTRRPASVHPRLEPLETRVLPSIFLPQTPFQLASAPSPSGVAAGDLNVDGHLDLATINQGSMIVDLLKGDGTGTFVPFAVQNITATTNPVAIAVADINGDGLPDVVLAYATSSNNISVWLGKGNDKKGNPLFIKPTQSFTATSPVAVAVGDVNGDGHLDVVTASATGTVTVLLGTGTGTFQPPTIPPATGKTPVAVALGDVNGDGKLDIVTANTDGSLSEWLGNGTGTFQAATNSVPFTGLTPVSLAGGDFNGDGKFDLAIGNGASGQVSVLLGNGTGNFVLATQNPSLSPGDSATAVAVGDVFGNGRPDLVAVGPNGAQGFATVLLNSCAHPATGNFSSLPNTSLPKGAHPKAIALADVNGDGILDLVVADTGVYGGTPGMNVSVLLGKGDGTFQLAQNFPTGQKPYAVAVADVNGDGHPDIITANYASNTVSVLLGNGDGTFKAAQNFSTDKGPVAVAVADVNGDGHPDIITANYYSNFNKGISSTVDVLLGTGTGSFQAARSSAVGNGPISLAVGDLNGDGHPDLVTASYGIGNGLSVLLNTGTGSFGPASTVSVGQTSLESVVVADVTGDGIPDLITANYSNGNVSVLAGIASSSGSGTGTFGKASNFPTDTGPIALAVADVNGDGKPDLISANYAGGDVTVLLGQGIVNGKLTFKAATNSPFATDKGAIALAVGDINGDGVPDLAVANLSGVSYGGGAKYTTGNVSVLLGQRNAATHFQVTAPASVTAGTAFSVTVTALTAKPENQMDCLYTGTVALTLGISDPNATLPAPHTFTLADGGSFTFQVTLGTATTPGMLQSIIATDMVNTTITGTSSNITVKAGAATKLVINQEPSAATAGLAFSPPFVIFEEDNFGNVETGDNSTQVTASLHSGMGPLQGKTTVTVSKGVATFTNLFDDKAETISLDFNGGGLPTVTSDPFTVSPAGASKLAINQEPTTATAGLAFSPPFVIFEEDNFGNVETGDNSTQVTASLHSGTGPLQGTTMVTVSKGVATFNNLFDDKAETISLDFNGGGLPTVTSDPFTVIHAAASQFKLVPSTNSPKVGVAFTITVTVQDPFHNKVTNYTGTVDFTSTDGSAMLPGPHTFTTGTGKDNGVHTFNVTLNTTGTQMVTVTDKVNMITKTVTLNVTPAPPSPSRSNSGSGGDTSTPPPVVESSRPSSTPTRSAESFLDAVRVDWVFASTNWEEPHFLLPIAKPSRPRLEPATLEQDALGDEWAGF